MNLDILFLGRLFPKQQERAIQSKMKAGMADAANALQWNIIDGMEENNCGSLKICNYLPVGSYPFRYTDLFIREFYFSHRGEEATDVTVGYLNLTGIKQFTNIIPFRKKIRHWAKQSSEQEKILFLYTAESMFLQLAQYAKRLNPNIKTVCLIADLPEYSTLAHQKWYQNALKNHKAKQSQSLYKNVDKFVLLTAQMAEKLQIKTDFLVMEGIATDENVETDDSVALQYKNQNYILYSGTLVRKFGIGVLLEAFSRIPDPDIKLLICGCGEAEQEIRQSNDSRIVFLGLLNRSQVIPLQRNAAVLVNPRQNNEEFTKYSFPSKTMEYLASGSPVVAYKLDGIPEEYSDYIHYVDDNSPQALADALQKICALSSEERRRIGQKAKDFVTKEKNAKKQTKKILDFILC